MHKNIYANKNKLKINKMTKYIKTNEFIFTSSNEEKRGLLEVLYEDNLYQVNLDPIFFSKYKPLNSKSIEFLFNKDKNLELSLDNNVLTVNMNYELVLDNSITFVDVIEFKLSLNSDTNVKSNFLLSKRIRELENRLKEVDKEKEKEKEKSKYSYTYTKGEKREVLDDIKEPKNKIDNISDVLDDIIVESVNSIRDNMKKRKTNTTCIYDFFGY